MFLVCRVVACTKVVVPDSIKEENEGLNFTAFFLSNFDCDTHSFVAVYLADDGCGENFDSNRAPAPPKSHSHFGKTYMKSTEHDCKCDVGTEGELGLVDVLMSSVRRQVHESR